MKPAVRIEISLEDQRLYLLQGGELLRVYAVSTARNGAGQRNGSECTPLGRHIVRARIGADQPAGTIFVARRPTGEVFSRDMLCEFPERDWILSRILWLSGAEPGRNRLGEVDTMRRYIYIHGTPDAVPVGVAGSHGCVRMHNDDVIDLFDRVPAGTPVNIVAGPAGL
ncbi:MAG: L,D-transpeptidase [Gammaproteobacteria bacterium]|nr:L,D-transpeptidase [Gammaproteobacteria bacterium]NNF59784.1 L,D-transpeptidase [Gammaproteobacteria bacterium]NNM20978.1 L,D-transpeptidase [Gammaproteobacteria bacterium]